MNAILEADAHVAMNPGHEGEWNINTLKTYVLALLEEMDRRHVTEQASIRAGHDADLRSVREMIEGIKEGIATARAAAEKAGDKTEAALREYKVQANEWRSTLEHIIDDRPSKNEVNLMVDKVGDRTTAIADRVATIENRNRDFASQKVGVNLGWIAAGSVLGLVVTALAIYAAFNR